jgi:hypothetical protein
MEIQTVQPKKLDVDFLSYFRCKDVLITMQNQKNNNDQDRVNISQKLELKFFIYMTIVFFALPLAIIQIPGIEKIGQAILSPFMRVIDSR